MKVKLRIVGRLVTEVCVLPALAELELELDADPDPDLAVFELASDDPPAESPPPSWVAWVAFFSFDRAVTDFEVDAVTDTPALGAAEALLVVAVAALLRPVVEVLPPTMPTKASTMHLTVVFDELSTVPVSTTMTDIGAWRTSVVSKACGGAAQSCVGEIPRCQEMPTSTSVAAPRTKKISFCSGEVEFAFTSRGVDGVIWERSIAMVTPALVEFGKQSKISQAFDHKPGSTADRGKESTWR